MGCHIICQYNAVLVCSLPSLYLITALDHQAFWCRMLGMVQTYNPAFRRQTLNYRVRPCLKGQNQVNKTIVMTRMPPGMKMVDVATLVPYGHATGQSETNFGYVRLDAVLAMFCQYDNIFRNKPKGGSICFSSQFQRSLAPLFLGLHLIQSSILAESMWWTKWLTSCYPESEEKRLETGYTPPQCNSVASWGQASNIPAGNDFTS